MMDALRLLSDEVTPGEMSCRMKKSAPSTGSASAFHIAKHVMVEAPSAAYLVALRVASRYNRKTLHSQIG